MFQGGIDIHLVFNEEHFRDFVFGCVFISSLFESMLASYIDLDCFLTEGFLNVVRFIFSKVVSCVEGYLIYWIEGK